MADVIKFNGITVCDLNADDLLDGAKGKLTDVVILGYQESDGEYYFAASKADLTEILWIIEQCKHQIMHMDA